MQCQVYWIVSAAGNNYVASLREDDLVLLSPVSDLVKGMAILSYHDIPLDQVFSVLDRTVTYLDTMEQDEVTSFCKFYFNLLDVIR